MPKPISQLRAIGYALTGFTLWVVTDAGVKLVAQASIPPYEVICFLGFVGALFMMLKQAPQQGMKSLWPKEPRRQLLLAISGLVTNLLNVVALKHLPLTIFYILVFMAPMIIALLAASFLKERLSLFRGIAIVAGFIGVVIAVNPMQGGSGGDAWGYAAGIGSAFTFAVNITLARSITQSESIESVTFFNGLVQGLFCLGPTVMNFVFLSRTVLIILMVTGLLNVIANLAIFKSIKQTTAATVSQFHYTQIIFGAIIGFLIWHEIPTPRLIVGALIIIVSGLYIAAQARNIDKAMVMPD